MGIFNRKETMAKNIVLPGKEGLQEQVEALKAPASLSERLHSEQLSDRQAIIEIQQRMKGRREQIAFLEDVPNAELMVAALARFYAGRKAGD